MTATTHADQSVPLSVSVTAIDGHPALRVHGEVDLASSPAFRAYLDALIAASEGDLVVDLAGLDFIDSAGIAQLVGAIKRLPHGRTLYLHHASRSLRKALAITGVAGLRGLAIRET